MNEWVRVMTCSRAGLGIWLSAALLGISFSPSWAQSPGDQANSTATENSVASSSDAKPDPDAYTDAAAQRFYERVFKRLNKMKVYDQGKAKSDSKKELLVAGIASPGDANLSDKSAADLLASDSFVIGTAAVHPVTQHADVCFRAVSGVDATAREITRFQGTTYARGEISRWHVFYRVTSGDDSQELLAKLQRQYDQAAAYRLQLMQQYQARTIRRC